MVPRSFLPVTLAPVNRPSCSERHLGRIRMQSVSERSKVSTTKRRTRTESISGHTWRLALRFQNGFAQNERINALFYAHKRLHMFKYKYMCNDICV